MIQFLFGLLAIAIIVSFYAIWMWAIPWVLAALNIGLSQSGNGVMVGDKIVSEEAMLIVMLLPGFIWLCYWIGGGFVGEKR